MKKIVVTGGSGRFGSVLKKFKTKKLNAYWYSPPKDIPNLPKVFISECKVAEFSKPVQDIIYNNLL